MDQEGGIRPAEIVEADRGDLASAKAQAGQQQQDRVVPQAPFTGPVTARQQPGDGARGETAPHAVTDPGRVEPGNRRRQVRRDTPGGEQEPQQRAHETRRGHCRSAARPPAGQHGENIQHPGGGQPPQLLGPARQLIQELPGDPQLVTDGPGSQAAFLQQVHPVGIQKDAMFGTLRRDHRDGALIAQERQRRSQATHGHRTAHGRMHDLGKLRHALCSQPAC
ncbi:MAG TPA: hypothetical protein VF070_48015 [Streptosporangiaceae bacterium]